MPVRLSTPGTRPAARTVLTCSAAAAINASDHEDKEKPMKRSKQPGTANPPKSRDARPPGNWFMDEAETFVDSWRDRGEATNRIDDRWNAAVLDARYRWLPRGCHDLARLTRDEWDDVVRGAEERWDRVGELKGEVAAWYAELGDDPDQERERGRARDHCARIRSRTMQVISCPMNLARRTPQAPPAKGPARTRSSAPCRARSDRPSHHAGSPASRTAGVACQPRRRAGDQENRRTRTAASAETDPHPGRTG